MLLSLTIRDFVLIDKAEIAFTKGLNILTGETGSGKSAIMEALSLILGAKADAALVRKGQEKASIEALFELSPLDGAAALLNSMGIDSDDSVLHIKREISKEGKSRIWINREVATLASLKSLSPLLMEFVGQRAAKELFDVGNHLIILDSIGDLTPLRVTFQESFHALTEKRAELRQFTDSIDLARALFDKKAADLKEIEAVSPLEGEDDALFEEYSTLSNVEELKENLQGILDILINDESGVLSGLNAVRKKTEEYLRIDQKLKDPLEMTKEALANMKEVERTLSLRLSDLEINPERLYFLSERLKAIERLKKLYGPRLEDVLRRWKELKEELSSSFDADERIESLEQEIRSLTAHTDRLAQELSLARQNFAKIFAKKVTAAIRTLNMPSANFSVEMNIKPRSASGDDLIEFYLAPNLGENPVSVSKAASGGELSRVLLAIKLVESSTNTSIVFDEIDANIGGSTSAVIGKQLKELGERKQILLITHFPQLARFACRHLKISKKEEKGRTYTHIEALEADTREGELARMMGSCVL
ncbi:DNA repair protein RecN [Estrella lausannensis]|uniref:DNA repair protein RecN n=1 Tax=Estrella lausannensis TaxID=483423 RepID=A0A0H5DRU3_9BACT|nr:DNA repair protein RecN [Estrella lausannensis]CRX39436.1 DNA repair protein RecN [Estrella lausannensis]